MSAIGATNALIARNPGVSELRREHATIMRLPMIGTAMAGDPGLQSYAHDQDAWRLCQYAAALAVKRGVVPADLAGLDGIFEAPRTVVFVRADGAQTEIGRVILPAHVPDYTPLPPPDAAIAAIGDQGTTTIFVPSNEAGKMAMALARPWTKEDVDTL